MAYCQFLYIVKLSGGDCLVFIIMTNKSNAYFQKYKKQAEESK